MTTIYGLREVGDTEFRYIGRSGKPLHLRLHKHKLNAARQYPPLISAWINEGSDIEIIPLVNVGSDQACSTERAFVERYYSLGHRLTNKHLRPRNSVAA